MRVTLAKFLPRKPGNTQILVRRDDGVEFETVARKLVYPWDEIEEELADDAQCRKFLATTRKDSVAIEAAEAVVSAAIESGEELWQGGGLGSASGR